MLDAVTNPLINMEGSIFILLDIQSLDHMNLERTGNGVMWTKYSRNDDHDDFPNLRQTWHVHNTANNNTGYK
jgi:hypothetical protein